MNQNSIEPKDGEQTISPSEASTDMPKIEIVIPQKKYSTNGKVKTLMTQLSNDTVVRRKKTVHEGIDGEMKQILKNL